MLKNISLNKKSYFQTLYPKKGIYMNDKFKLLNVIPVFLSFSILFVIEIYFIANFIYLY